MTKRFRFLIIAPALVLLGAPAVLITGAVVFESDNGRCAACHTEPESTFVMREALPAVDLATQHLEEVPDFLCIDCHSGEGIVGRSQSILQGALDVYSFVTNNFDEPGTTSQPIGDDGCIKCHLYDPGYYSESVSLTSSHYHNWHYLVAWQAVDFEPSGRCQVCHSSHMALHVDQEDPRSRAHPRAECETCHLALSGWRSNA